MSRTRDLTLLLATDGSAYSEAAVRLLADLSWPEGTRATVLAVVPEHWVSLKDRGPTETEAVIDVLTRLRRTAWETARATAARAAETLRASGLMTTVEVQEARPADAVLGLAAGLPADLIALGAQGLGPRGELRLGSTARQIVREAPCSVLVARPGKRAEWPVRVLLAVEGSPDGRRAVDWLEAVSSPRTEVLVASVARSAASRSDEARRADPPSLGGAVSPDEAEARVAEAVDRLRARGTRVRSIVRSGRRRAELVRLARQNEVDVIVVGAWGTGELASSRLSGMAGAVVKYAPCSVLVARHTSPRPMALPSSPAPARGLLQTPAEPVTGR